MLRYIALLILLWLAYELLRVVLRHALRAGRQAAQKAAHAAAQRVAEEAARRAGQGHPGAPFGGARPSPQPAKAVGELVSCQRCGIYLPKGRALKASGAIYCSETCRQPPATVH